MKRFKNLVIGGIESKVFNLILLTVLLMTAAYMAVSLYHTNMLTNLTAESTRQQRTAIEETTVGIMSTVIDQSMGQATELEAYIADEVFHSLETRVRMLGDYARKLFSDPDAYPKMPFFAPDPEKDGQVTAQLIAAPGVDISSAQAQSSIGLAANMSDMLCSLFTSSESTNSCFIALPDGSCLIADDRSKAKLDEAGNPVPIDPRARPWYQQAVKKGDLIFTDMETDAFTGDIGIVCAMPVYANGELAAVVGSDLFLTSMQSAIQSSESYGSYNCVINQMGHVVFSPKTEGVFQVLSSDSAQDLRQGENEALSSLITDALAEKTNMRLISLPDGDYYMIGAPMKTLGWALISVCSASIAKEPAALMMNQYDRIQQSAVDTYQKETQHSKTTGTVLMVAVMILMLTGSLVLGKRIVKPLNTITKRISNLSEANLEFKMEDAYRTGDEVEELAESFAAISHKTVEYLHTVQQVTAEKERIGTELHLATQIQSAMLPHIFPAFPDRPDFDIFATMDPAKEVGGDFYDYFLIDEDHLCMVIADVSGKGIPAALFMMASKIILQSVAMLGKAPAEILEKTNEAICSNNEAQMFVTVWLGILELSTGKLRCANAGHEYPVFKHPDSNFELYKDRHGFVIGGMEGVKYREYELQLTPGCKLFVYTDGVPEATNANNELFGTERLVSALNEHPDASPVEMLKNMRKAVDAFVQNAEQFDDLTMLALEYTGIDRKKGEKRA